MIDTTVGHIYKSRDIEPVTFEIIKFNGDSITLKVIESEDSVLPVGYTFSTFDLDWLPHRYERIYGKSDNFISLYEKLSK